MQKFFKASDFKAGDEWVNPAVAHDVANKKIEPVLAFLKTAVELVDEALTPVPSGEAWIEWKARAETFLAEYNEGEPHGN